MKESSALKRKPRRIFTNEQLAKIRRQNKDRSKAMERQVTGHLNGKRTPMSGAGMIKGDGIVYLPDDNGICVLECKLTGALHETKGPIMAIESIWFTKLLQDVHAMKGLGAKFGMLIIKFMHIHEMYVFVRKEDINTIQTLLGVIVPYNEHVRIDLTPKTGKPWKIKQVLLSKIKETLYGTFVTPDGEYVILPFSFVKGWFRPIEG